MLAVNPEQLSRFRIECDDRPPRARRRVENTIHHQWRAFEFVFRTITEIVRLDAPGDLKIAEIGSVDLVKRPIPRARNVGGVRWPLGVLRVILCPSHRRDQARYS